MIEPLPKEIGHFDYVLHAAGIASPIFYRHSRSRRSTPTATASETFWITQLSSATRIGR
jgi:hypothetical protein